MYLTNPTAAAWPHNRAAELCTDVRRFKNEKCKSHNYAHLQSHTSKMNPTAQDGGMALA
jgi:hypothetical protein